MKLDHKVPWLPPIEDESEESEKREEDSEDAASPVPKIDYEVPLVVPKHRLEQGKEKEPKG